MNLGEVRADREEVKMKRILLSIVVIGVLLLSACDLSTTILKSEKALIAKAEVTDIRFTSRPSEEYVLFYIDVTPGYLLADSPYFVALLSKDGYFFDSNVIKWSTEDLRGAEQDERNYWKIQEAEERLIKHERLGAPANDKDIVLLQKAYNSMVEEGTERYQRKLQDYLQKGDMVSFLKEGDNPWEPTKADINRVCSRYIKVMVVDKEGLMKLKYPEGETKLIATYSGKGSFTTPTFTVTYDRLKTSWIGTPSGQFEYKLYTEDGARVGALRGSAEPDRKIHSGDQVKPGHRYYIEIIAPEEMQWTFWVEETNLP